MDTVVIEIRADYKDNTKGMSKSIDGMDKFSRSIDKTKQQLDKAATSTENWYQKLKRFAGKAISIPVKIVDYATKPLRSLYNFATSLKGVLTGLFIGQGFNKLVSSPLNLADSYSSAKIGFETLFQSASKAQKMMDEIDQFAIKTPFNTSSVISNIQKMMAYGWDASRMLKDMETIGNAAAATGKGDEGLGSIVYALSEIRSKGKLSTQELNQLASAGIKAKQYLAEGLGFGTDDAGMAKLAKALEKGKVGANQAIDLILEGMKEFDGMMDKTANETVGGLKAQLADVFEVNIARKWGQGLQDGAKRGLGAISAFLDENRGKLSDFGDQLYEIGETLSNWLADRAENAMNKLLEITNSNEFKDADLGGKFKLVWDEVVAEPFMTWWNGEGGNKFKAKAEEIGTSIGEWIGKGLSKAFSQIIPNLFKSAADVLPGGAAPGKESLMSAAVLAFGAKSLGLGKLAGWGLGKLAGGAAAGAAASGAGGAAVAGGIGLSATTVGGIVGAGLGLMSAANDLKAASDSMNKQNKRDYIAKGVTKGVMTGLGALIGTLIAPGVGTAVGAGLGGAAATLVGGKLGTTIMHKIDGTAEIEEGIAMVEEAVTAYNEAKQAFETGKGLIKAYEDANKTVKELEKVNDEYQKIKDRAAETEELKDKWETLNKAIKEGLFKGDELANAEKKIAEIESDLVTLYPELKGQIDLQEDGWDSISGKIAAINDKDMETLKSKYSDLDTLEADLKTALDDRSTAISELAKQYEGYITKYETEHGLLQTTIDKLKEINEEERKRKEYALTDMRQTVLEELPHKEEIEQNIQTAEVEAEKAEALYKANVEAVEKIEALQKEYTNIDTDDTEKLLSELKKIEDERKAVYKKYGELSSATVYHDMGNNSFTLGGFYNGGTVDDLRSEASDMNAGVAENAGAIAKDREWLGVLYGAQRSLIEENDLKNYSGTYSELMSKLTGGDWSVFGELKSMIEEIKALESTYTELDESQKLNTAEFWNQIIENTDLSKIYDKVGWEKIENPKTEEDLLYNSVVEQKLEESNAKFEEMVTLLRELQENPPEANGEVNDTVKKAQEFMAETIGKDYFDEYGVDGKWGAETSKSVESFLAALDGGLTTVNSWRNNSLKPQKGFATSGTELIGILTGTGKGSGGKTGKFKDETTVAKGTKDIDYGGVRQFSDEVAAQAESVAGSGSAMASSIDTASASNGNYAESANAAGTAASTAAGSVTDLSNKSTTSAGSVDALGTNSGISAGSVSEMGATASDAAGKISGFSSFSIAAGLSVLALSTGASNVASALNDKAGQIRSISIPSAVGGGGGAGKNTTMAYAEGGILTGPEFILAGEDGDEAIIPLSKKHRRRGLGLFKEAAKRMGIPMMAKGGIVGGGSDGSEIAAVGVSAGGISVSLGGMSFTIQAGSGDSESIINAIKANMPSVANEVANAIAAALEQTYSNMATQGV